MTPAVSCAIIAGIWVAFFQTIVRTVASDDGLVLLPPWKPSWNMSLSTVIQPCNASGMFDTAFGSRFGIVDFDFENAWKQWSNEKPMDAETLMVEAAVSNQVILTPLHVLGRISPIFPPVFSRFLRVFTVSLRRSL